MAQPRPPVGPDNRCVRCGLVLRRQGRLCICPNCILVDCD